MRRAADITTRPLQLSELLEGIENASVVLPDFQRLFEWQEPEVLSLVATVMAGWPAGSLLLMRGKPEFFETRPFEGVSRRTESVDYVVLDGQQRLTALFRALRGVEGSPRYAVNLAEIDLEGEIADELEESFEVLSEGGSTTELGKSQVPLTALNSAPDYFEWIERVVEPLSDEENERARTRLRDAYKDFLGTVNHYTFPSVILEPDLPTPAVARIFERINKGGLQLSTFDLLVARAYRPGWNLRERWQAVKDEEDLIPTYLGDDGLPLVQSITVTPRASRPGDIRRPALLRVPPDTLRQQWDSTVDAYSKALNFVARSGMRNADWVPYRIAQIPLAALARDFDLEDHRELLEAWLWARGFNMDFDVASSTMAVADYVRLRDALSGVAEPPRFEINLTPLLTATRRAQGAVWRTFLSFLLKLGATDPWTGDSLVPTPNDAGGVVVDSLFSGDPSSGAGSPHLAVLSQFLRARRPRGASADPWVLNSSPLASAAFQSQLLEGIVPGSRNAQGAVRHRLRNLQVALSQHLQNVDVKLEDPTFEEE